MLTEIDPFIDGTHVSEGHFVEWLTGVASESSLRRPKTPVADPDETLGLDRLATFMDTIRNTEGLSWREFALSAHPKPFNPVFLMLMSMGLITRREITDEVVDALAGRLHVSAHDLRSLFVVEEVAKPTGIFAALRLPRIRISAPLNAFAPPRTASAILGDTPTNSGPYVIGESPFPESGLNVRYTLSQGDELVVVVETDLRRRRRVPNDLVVSVVAAIDGAVKAGPLRMNKGRTEFQRIDWDPLDRLIIERAEHESP